MPDKPAGMSWESFAEASVRKAMEEGQFHNLPGAGKPIEGLADPYRDDWWLAALLKREDLSVPCAALDIRADVERTLARLMRSAGETSVRREVADLNVRIAKANRSVTSGPSTSAAVLDVEAVVTRWRKRTRQRAIDSQTLLADIPDDRARRALSLRARVREEVPWSLK